MKVSEILKLAAAHVGRADLKSYLSSPTDDTDLAEEAENLLMYYNGVEKEISEYFPLLAEEIIKTHTGIIEYADFERPPVFVRGIYNFGGGRVNAEYLSDFIRVPSGKYRVVYGYLPFEKGFDDECEKFYCVPDVAFVAGVAKNYCLAAGMSEECAMWNQTFYDSVQSAHARADAHRRIAGRRWV